MLREVSRTIDNKYRGEKIDLICKKRKKLGHEKAIYLFLFDTFHPKIPLFSPLQRIKTTHGVRGDNLSRKYTPLFV